VGLDLDDSRPLYEQITAALAAEITTGARKPGDRMPAIRELAASYGVSPVVVQSAYRELRERKLIASWPGRGTVVREFPIAETQHDRVGELATAVARIEANLIELYGRTGYDYPQDQDGTAPPGRHSRAGAS